MMANSPMYFFWDLAMQLQQNMLQFVKAIRIGDRNMYMAAVKQMVPWFFMFNHPNYARWISVYINDIESLYVTSPSLHESLQK